MSGIESSTVVPLYNFNYNLEFNGRETIFDLDNSKGKLQNTGNNNNKIDKKTMNAHGVDISKWPSFIWRI